MFETGRILGSLSNLPLARLRFLYELLCLSVPSCLFPPPQKKKSSIRPVIYKGRRDKESQSHVKNFCKTLLGQKMFSFAASYLTCPLSLYGWVTLVNSEKC